MELPAKRARMEQNEEKDKDPLYSGLQAILPPDFSEDIPLMAAHSCELESKQQLQGVIQELSQKMPHFQHLKRVQDRKVLICPSSDIEDTLEAHLERHAFSQQVLSALLRQVQVVEVPAAMPRLRRQYEKMLQYWPCKFHPNHYTESLENGSNFTTSERQFHKMMAQLLLRLSKEVNKGQPVSVCVDPRRPSLVAIAGGSSSSSSQPHEHSSLLLMDFVARTQQGVGALNTGEEFVQPPGGQLSGLPSRFYEYLKQQADFKNLNYGAEVTASSVERLESPKADNLDKYGPYLCTGYDVYLLREPCLLCSMAWVHSRAKRIFFLETSQNGALISSFQLHAVKELNHHYEVYQFTKD